MVERDLAKVDVAGPTPVSRLIAAIFIFPVFLSGFIACVSRGDPISGQYDYKAPFAAVAPVIDGKGDDLAWAKAEWRPIDQVWLGGGNASASNLTPPPEGAYSGRFKIVWTEDRLYFLAEIMDTQLSLSRINDPYDEIYKDDCLELFINEDGKGGMHENNNKAFAYHMSYDGVNAMDYVSGQSGSPFKNGYIKRNHHLKYKIGNLDLANSKSIDSIDGSNIYTWEVEMKIYPAALPINDNPDTFPAAEPVKLSEGKVMGFAVAYCNAGKKPGAEKGTREYFMGSMFVEGTNKNVAYQNASVFAKLHLEK